MAELAFANPWSYLVIDRTKAWDDEDNLVLKTRNQDSRDHWVEATLGEIKPYRYPADPAEAAPNSPGLTNYVGLSGVGPDAAELDLGYPGVGFFGCERRLKIEDIKDGMANTVAVMETNRENGSWTAGGLPTTRGLNPAGGHYLGAGGQFSSGHSSSWAWLSSSSTLTNVLYGDGSVRGLTESVSPQVLEALVTIAGGEEVGQVADWPYGLPRGCSLLPCLQANRHEPVSSPPAGPARAVYRGLREAIQTRSMGDRLAVGVQSPAHRIAHRESHCI